MADAQTARRQQLQLRAVTLRQLLTLWPIWNLDEATFNRFLAATLPMVRQRHRDSAGLAAAYYRSVAPKDPVIRLAPFNAEQVVTSLSVTGPVFTAKALRAGLPADAAKAQALVRVSGAVSRLVMQGGRQTLLESVKADPQARGWRRVTSGRACPFCTLLAGRGAVYSADTVDFQAHDHCSCFSEPVFA